MSKKRKKRKQDLLNQQMCAGFTKEVKLALRDIKYENSTTYAAMIREAVYDHFGDELRKRIGDFDGKALQG